jgi:hypothetical protein
MTIRTRTVVLLAATALVAGVAACGKLAPQGAGGTPSAPPGSTPASGTPTGGVPTGGQPTTGAPATSKPAAGAMFTLAAGREHDVCGIGVMVTFVPPAGQQYQGYQAFIVGGAVGHVGGSGGDNPMPGNVAPANPGMTVTVAGVRFRVHSVDTAASTATLEAMC